MELNGGKMERNRRLCCRQDIATIRNCREAYFFVFGMHTIEFLKRDTAVAVLQLLIFSDLFNKKKNKLKIQNDFSKTERDRNKKLAESIMKLPNLDPVVQ